MAVVDAYPTGLRIDTTINDDLTDYTIFFYAKCWFFGTPNPAFWISRGQFADIWVGRESGADKFRAGFAGDSSPNVISSAALVTQTWYSVCVRRDTATAQLTIRINGTAYNQSSAPTTPSNGGRNFRIGCSYDDVSNKIFGAMRRLAIYSKALSDKEMESLEKGFSPLKVSTPNIVAYAPFLDSKTNTFGRKTVGSGSDSLTIDARNTPLGLIGGL